jgi:hypothetical protein
MTQNYILENIFLCQMQWSNIEICMSFCSNDEKFYVNYYLFILIIILIQIKLRCKIISYMISSLDN